jgi:TonB family protein
VRGQEECVPNSERFVRVAAVGAMLALVAGAAQADQTRPRPAAGFARPHYPIESQALREEGDVVVELCVAATGVVESVKLLRSSGYQRLDEATIAGLTTSRFDPATDDGKPVRFCGYLLTVAWAMEDTDQNAAAPS